MTVVRSRLSHEGHASSLSNLQCTNKFRYPLPFVMITSISAASSFYQHRRVACKECSIRYNSPSNGALALFAATARCPRSGSLRSWVPESTSASSNFGTREFSAQGPRELGPKLTETQLSGTGQSGNGDSASVPWIATRSVPAIVPGHLLAI